MGSLVRLIDIERSQFGIREDPIGSNKNPYSRALGRVPESWCADFQAWAFAKAGVKLPSTSASTINMATAFKKINRLYTSPKPGDLAFMGTSGSTGGIEHVGLVVSVNSSRSYCNTIDGNTTWPKAPAGTEREGIAVGPKVRYYGSEYIGLFHIIAFGRPTYDAPQAYKPPKGYSGSLVRILKRGNMGRDVKRVQKLVGVTADGEFGKITEAAVMRWQRHHGLTGRQVDGECGPQFCRKAHWKWAG